MAVGASVGAGCQPCVAHHLKAGAKVGLDPERLLAAVTSAERVTAEAAVAMGDHVRGKLGPTVTAPTLLSRLEEALASFGAALGANDAKDIERQLRAAVELGASRPQLQRALETAQTVQENAARIHLREAECLLDAAAPAVATPDGESESGGGCGCGAEDEPEAAPLEAQAPDPAVETSEDGAAEAASTAACGLSAGFTDSIAGRFGAGSAGEMGGIADAMADCRRMFAGKCGPPAAPAETNEPPPAAGSDTKEV